MIVFLLQTQRKGAGFDAIHDQTAYLEKEDLDNLKEMSHVESYPILQFLGDAIFIPSGAPHQVKEQIMSLLLFYENLLGEKFTFMH